MHGCRGIFGTYVAEQLNQGVDVGVRLQLRVIRIFWISEWADYIVRKLCADKSHSGAIAEEPRSVEC